MGFGASLVSDDQVILSRDGADVVATCPAPIQGLIEARGIGLLKADGPVSCRVACIVDMDQVEVERLPPLRTRTLLDVTLTCLHKVEDQAFPAAILQYLRCGRQEP